MTKPIENNLQKEYKRLLASIRPLIADLESSQDVTNCLLWLSRLHEVSAEERPLRNELLQQLLTCVVRKHLSHPFSTPPPDGQLKGIAEQRDTTVKTTLSTTRELDSQRPTVISSQQILPEAELAKYRNRSKKHKSNIAKYQILLKDILQTSQMESEVESENINIKIETTPRICRCDQETQVSLREEPRQLDARKFVERIERLEKENKRLSVQCSKFEALLINKRNGSTRKKSKEMNRFQTELTIALAEKEKTISKLESELKALSDQSSLNSSLLEKTMVDKCNELEVRYNNVLESFSEQHKKERDDDRRKIEKLEKILLLSGRSGKRM